MQDGMHQKSTYDVWQFWAKVLDRHLKRCVDVYKEHKGNAEKAQAIIDRLEFFIDPVTHAQDLAAKNYDVKGSVDKLYLLSLTVLQKVFTDTLKVMPEISADMQNLLNSPCFGDCKGRQAMDIFKGPHRTSNEGIGSGASDQYGTLPWMLAKILDEADIGGEDYFKKGLKGNLAEQQAEGAGSHDALERHESSYKPRKKETLTGIS